MLGVVCSVMCNGNGAGKPACSLTVRLEWNVLNSGGSGDYHNGIDMYNLVCTQIILCLDLAASNILSTRKCPAYQSVFSRAPAFGRHRRALRTLDLK